MSNINYCPRCKSAVEDLGIAEMDKHIADCESCGYVEISYYHIGEELPDTLTYLQDG